MTSVAGADAASFLGCEVSVALTTNERYSGELVFYDSESASFGIRSLNPGSTRNSSLHWIRTSSLQSIQVTRLPPATLPSAARGLAYVDTGLLSAFAEEKFRSGSQPKFNHPAGASREAQELFELLSKTMPCTWSGLNIQVYSVTIRSPYQTTDCSGGSEAELERIQRIVGEFHRVRKIAA